MDRMVQSRKLEETWPDNLEVYSLSPTARSSSLPSTNSFLGAALFERVAHPGPVRYCAQSFSDTSTRSCTANVEGQLCSRCQTLQAVLGDAELLYSFAPPLLAPQSRASTNVPLHYSSVPIKQSKAKQTRASPTLSASTSLPLPTPAKSTPPSPSTCATPPPSWTISSSPQRGRRRREQGLGEGGKEGKATPAQGCSTPRPQALGARTRSSSSPLRQAEAGGSANARRAALEGARRRSNRPSSSSASFARGEGLLARE